MEEARNKLVVNGEVLASDFAVHAADLAEIAEKHGILHTAEIQDVLTSLRELRALSLMLAGSLACTVDLKRNLSADSRDADE